MRDSNTTPMRYRGDVNVDIKINGRTISLHTHNEGENYLKKAFAKFLTGNFSKYDIPYYLDLRYTEDEEITSESEWRSWLIQDIELTGKKYQQITGSVNWQAIFTATFPYNALENEITTSTPGTFRLHLYTLENTEDYPPVDKQSLAWIDVDKDDLSQIVEGSQAIVYWRMMLLNESEIEETN